MSEKHIQILSTRIPESIFEAVRRTAKENDRSLSSELRRTIVAAYGDKVVLPVSNS